MYIYAYNVYTINIQSGRKCKAPR